MSSAKTNAISGITRNISFRLVEVSDAKLILELRLDSSRNRYLSPVADDIASQRKWIEAYKAREAAKQEFYYVIMDKQQSALGLVRLYDFVDDSFSWGSWILRPKAPVAAAIESALMVYEIAFYSLGFICAKFDVRKENESVVRFHRKFGAVCTREDNLNYYFQMEKGAYEKAKQRYMRYLSRE